MCHSVPEALSPQGFGPRPADLYMALVLMIIRCDVLFVANRCNTVNINRIMEAQLNYGGADTLPFKIPLMANGTLKGC